MVHAIWSPPPNPSLALMPARGPLKKTLDLMMDWAVLAWMKNEDCFSYSPTSRMTLPTTCVQSAKT